MTPEHRAELERQLTELAEKRRRLVADVVTGMPGKWLSESYRLGARRRWLLSQLEGERKRGQK